MSASTWVQVITGLFAFIAFLAGAAGVARVSLFKEQLKALRGDRDDLMARVKRLEEEATAKDVDMAALRESLRAERDKVKFLEEMATGRDMLKSLQETLSERITSVSGEHEQILHAIRSLQLTIASQVAK